MFVCVGAGLDLAPIGGRVVHPRGIREDAFVRSTFARGGGTTSSESRASHPFNPELKFGLQEYFKSSENLFNIF